MAHRERQEPAVKARRDSKAPQEGLVEPVRRVQAELAHRVVQARKARAVRKARQAVQAVKARLVARVRRVHLEAKVLPARRAAPGIKEPQAQCKEPLAHKAHLVELVRKVRQVLREAKE